MTASVGQKDSGGNCSTVGQRQRNTILRAREEERQECGGLNI